MFEPIDRDWEDMRPVNQSYFKLNLIKKSNHKKLLSSNTTNITGLTTKYNLLLVNFLPNIILDQHGDYRSSYHCRNNHYPIAF